MGPYLSQPQWSLFFPFFADSSTPITKATPKSIHMTYNCMTYFFSLSGQSINTVKSKAIFSTICPTSAQTLVKNLFNINPSLTFKKYLVFPILNQKSKCKDFQFLIDNMRKKLSTWKTNFLSQAGRLVLAKSTLNSIPAYTMQ